MVIGTLLKGVNTCEYNSQISFIIHVISGWSGFNMFLV